MDETGCRFTLYTFLFTTNSFITGWHIELVSMGTSKIIRGSSLILEELINLI